MRGLVALGILLVIAWVIAFVVLKIAGLLIHLLLLAGVVVLILGLIRRIRGRPSSL
jgi:hypothetical protein